MSDLRARGYRVETQRPSFIWTGEVGIKRVTRIPGVVGQTTCSYGRSFGPVHLPADFTREVS